MKELFYLGTYTKRASQGVYSVQLDTEKKQLEPAQLVAEIDSPTYLTLNETATTLYAVSKQEGLGGVTVLQKNEQGNFTVLDQDHYAIAPPCYIAYDQANQTLVTSNYHAGTVTLYTIKSNGKLTRMDEVTHEGSSIHPNQTAPHVHYSHPTPDGAFIIVCDLGTDRVVTYRISAEQTLEEVSAYTAVPGSGPRHLTFHSTLPIAYLLCELNATIEVLSFDAESGSFQRIEQVDLLPNRQNEQQWGAAIRTTKDGQYLYATNRGYDVLVAYHIDIHSGTLHHIQTIETGGSVARDFNFNSDERFIIVAHQESDHLSLFERDTTTGLVQRLSNDCYAPEAVCVYCVQTG